MAAAAGLAVEIAEASLPLRDEVAGLCEILGLDPLYLANEGRLVLFCPEDQADAALAAMRALPEGAGAVAIGRAMAGMAGRVTLRTRFGGARIVDMLVGDQLPRIC
jgi:hydrogenase expression/formation protein HypE